MSFKNVEKVWTPESFREYLERLGDLAWADSVCVHHTAFPDMAMRPHGFIIQHMRNIQHGYQNTRGWKAGPHLFTDRDQIFGMSPLTARGIHAVSFNRRSFGIEALGNFDSEDPLSGRGFEVMQTTAWTVRLLLEKIGQPINASTVKFHRDDPKTRKTCPGRLVKKDWFVELVASGAGPIVPKVPQREREESVPRPSIPGWDSWQFVDGGWCVPVLDFLDHVGGDRRKVLENMKSRSGQFYYEDDLIETAFYDGKTQTTWASARELLGFSEEGAAA